MFAKKFNILVGDITNINIDKDRLVYRPENECLIQNYIPYLKSIIQDIKNPILVTDNPTIILSFECIAKEMNYTDIGYYIIENGNIKEVYDSDDLYDYFLKYITEYKMYRDEFPIGGLL